jgi:hypothetical protein
MDEPQDDNWYLRNRSRDAIVAMIRVVREIQLICNFRNSDILKVMGNIYRQTGDAKFGNYLYQLGVLLQRDELSGKN